jgi:predicted RecA/RadA family phage recombinase
LQWLQDPSEIIVDNLSIIRREARKHFRNKKKGYLKDKINETASSGSYKYIEICTEKYTNLRDVTNLEVT